MLKLTFIVAAIIAVIIVLLDHTLLKCIVDVIELDPTKAIR